MTRNAAAFDFFRSFAGKMAMLLVIFLVFPVLLYQQLAAADRAKNALLIDSIQREGELVVRSLRPVLDRFTTVTPAALQEALDRLRIENRTVKVLARPDLPGSPPRFYYIAASPKVTRQRLDEERTMLLATGLFDRLSDTCEGNRPLAMRFVNPDGQAEILSSLAPVQTGDTCFVVITAHTGPEFLETALGQPFWHTRTLQVAALMYILMAVIVIWLFADARRNLNRFRATARMIRIAGPGAESFATRNRIPELSTVAEDIDRLVEDLDRSRRFIRDAAEETAHTLKGPLTVIAQAVEPLKRLTGGAGEQAHRCFRLIESSIGRMDAMISATRDLERLVAETMARDRQPVNVAALFKSLGAGYQASLSERGIKVDTDIADEADVIASEDALETIFENILENAASFAPPGSRIMLTLARNDGWVVADIADEGPGVDPQHVEAIFERYVSLRDNGGKVGRVQPTTSFGLGLWIVRRNVEALGGNVVAANRSPHGLQVTVRLPLAR